MVTNSAGCEGTSNDVDVIINGLEEQLGEFGFAVWPNPSSGILNVQVAEVGSLVRIYSSKGQLAFDKVADEQLNVIDTHGFSPGVYLVSISHGNAVATQRIVVE